MFKIRRVHNANSLENQAALASVLRIYEDAFSYYPQYTSKIAKLLKMTSQNDFDVILMVAEGHKNRILGFTLTFYFPKLKFGYLDYLASDPKRNQRGYGSSLYESTRNYLREIGCTGLFMDVPPDDVEKLKEPSRIKINKKRMAFYERFGAYPIVDTKYDSVSHKANQGYFTYLVYDNFNEKKPLKSPALKKFIARILQIKGNMLATDTKVKEILASIKGDLVKLRAPRYQVDTSTALIEIQQMKILEYVTTGDAHQIHHLREKGYVERPVRVNFLLKGLEGFELKTHKMKHFGQKHILEVHHSSLFEFLKKAQTELEPGQLVYPNVFPIRKPDRIPKNWEMQAGYYCIDSFTPVTANSYKAARQAVDSALTGAECLLKGSENVFVLCRPPGHHAESRVFGGFCYFNNAAIAANYLSKKGKVAFIDLDYHHGNGSQEIFYKRKDVYFISIHGHPRLSYPYFSGFSDELGEGKGLNYNKNYPLYPGINDDEYLSTLNKALNTFKAFKPDYFVISLGFDIMAGDPTGAFNLTPEGMRRIGSVLGKIPIPKLIVQEGGYALKNLRLGSKGFFSGLLDTSFPKK